MRSHCSICNFSGVLLLRASAPEEGPQKCSKTFPVSIRNVSRHIPGTRPETSRIIPENYLKISEVSDPHYHIENCHAALPRLANYARFVSFIHRDVKDIVG